MNDLVDRLKYNAEMFIGASLERKLLTEAAARITALEDERDRLREAHLASMSSAAIALAIVGDEGPVADFLAAIHHHSAMAIQSQVVPQTPKRTKSPCRRRTGDRG